MRVGFHTFGCKLNQYETEALASPLRSQGFSVAGVREEADVYVVNTCTVTARADHKARSLIRGLAREHPSSLLIVTGCAAQLEAQELGGLAPNVVVVPQSEKSVLLDLRRFVEQARAGIRPASGRPAASRSAGTPAGTPSDAPLGRFAFHVVQLTFHTRAFLKVQDGCDSWCTYCRVPLARGSSASLEPGEVLRRARDLEEAGSREIVITGVNISSWRSGGLGLAGLLGALLDATTRTRFRLSSLEPEAIDGELAGALAHRRVCPHFHLPVQSGSDPVLGRMKRRYRAQRVREGVALLRATVADPFLAADVIVGFPGETEADFTATRELVSDLRLAALHVFPFSPRPGTAAAGLRPRVPERVRDQRATALGELSRQLTASYAESWLGREVEVLVEKRVGGAVEGTSGNYLKVKIAGVPPGRDPRGSLVRARLEAAGKVCGAQFTGFVD
jgi:threonylcarbamoyladenosine tRNA methylthiotransferase MtaB